MMAIRYGLALAVMMLAMAASSVRACDDFDEEMALAAAREAVEVGRAVADGQAPSARADTLASGAGEATIAVAAEPRTVPRQAMTEPASILAR
jgi:hypothetical protein